MLSTYYEYLPHSNNGLVRFIVKLASAIEARKIDCNGASVIIEAAWSLVQTTYVSLIVCADYASSIIMPSHMHHARPSLS